MNFIIDENTVPGYTAVLHATDYTNPLHNVTNIEAELVKTNVPAGMILVDMLLCNGESFNRFAAVRFNGTHLLPHTIQVVTVNKESRGIINRFYHHKWDLIHRGVLSCSQRFKYLRY